MQIVGCFLFFFVTVPSLRTSAQRHDVLELDDSFLERRGDHSWLVKFYAPWCGHCRRLEPVWFQLHNAMKNSGIRVAKIDATRFPRVAAEFDVRGYPTIKFIQKDQARTYRGDRTRENLIEFAKRADGPLIRWLSNIGKFNDMKSELSTGTFFMYVGPNDEEEELLKWYTEVAEIYRVFSYFYAGAKEALPHDYKTRQSPTVLVVKDGKYYEYDPPKDGATKESLDDFVNAERFVAFPKISSGGMGELVGIDKKIVMIITDQSADDDPKQERMKHLGKMLATQHREKYHNHYQFIWMSDPETGNTITMSRHETPYVIVLEPETQYYHLPEQGFDVHKLTMEEAHTFLEDVIEGHREAHGGTGFGQRVKRLFYDLGTTIYGIYNESPWLALLVFGVPSLVISVICYALCCMEPIDEDTFYDELADEARDEQSETEGVTDAEGQDVLRDDQQLRKRLVEANRDTQQDDSGRSKAE